MLGSAVRAIAAASVRQRVEEAGPVVSRPNVRPWNAGRRGGLRPVEDERQADLIVRADRIAARRPTDYEWARLLALLSLAMSEAAAPPPRRPAPSRAEVARARAREATL